MSKVLAASPNNANALFSRVLANGLRGDYTAMIEKRNLASLSYMKTSRITAQQLLAIDPTCYDAYPRRRRGELPAGHYSRSRALGTAHDGIAD